MEMESVQTTDSRSIPSPVIEAADSDVLGKNEQTSASPPTTEPELFEEMPLQDEMYSNRGKPTFTTNTIDFCSDVKTENNADGEFEMEHGVASQEEAREDDSACDESAAVCQSDAVNSTHKYDVLKSLLNRNCAIIAKDVTSDSATDSQHAAQIVSVRRQSVRLNTSSSKQACPSRNRTASRRVKMLNRKHDSKQNASASERRGDKSHQDGSTMEILQVNTASLSTWALQVLEQAKTLLQQQQHHLLQQQQQQQQKQEQQQCQQEDQEQVHHQQEQEDTARTADLPAEVRFAVEILRSSQWQPCIIKAEDLHTFSPPVPSTRMSGGRRRAEWVKTDDIKPSYLTDDFNPSTLTAPSTQMRRGRGRCRTMQSKPLSPTAPTAQLSIERCGARSVKTGNINPSTSPKRDTMDTDLVDAVDNSEDNADDGEDVGDLDGVVNSWDNKWLMPTVLLENSDGASHADHAEGDQIVAETAASRKETANGLQKGPLVKFICRLCKKVCSSRGVLKRHMIETHSQRKSSLQFKCKLCGSVYKRKYCLVEHMRAHTGERSVECTECGAKFRYRSDMRKHFRHKHGGKKYLCKVCGRYLKSDRGFKYHMSTHDETLPIVCDRCGRSFRCKLALKRHHEYTHKEEYDSSVMCEMCSEMFPSGTALSRHQRAAKSGPCCSLRSGANSVHAQGKTSFAVVNCQVCGEGFKSDQQLQMHMGYHLGTRPFLCSECNLAFSRKDHYNTHLRNHKLKTLMSKTFDCHVCGVGMKTEKHLEMHMGFHTGDRPYQCSVCWLAFAKKDRLDTHKQSHNVDRVRFPCPTCGASFCTKALLKYHCVLRHNAETPHVCNTCGERFDRKCHLQQHMKGPCTSQAQAEQPSEMDIGMNSFQN